MNLTRQQKVLMGVLALGASAVVVDRVWLDQPHGGPHSASAEAIANPDQAMTVAELDTWIADIDNVAGLLSFADRLSSLRDHADTEADPLRDAFSPPRRWLGEAGQVDDRARAVAEAHARFIRAHRLDAVMLDGREGVAVINGKAVRVGELVDGYKLIDVQKKSASLQSGTDKEPVVLMLHGTDE